MTAMLDSPQQTLIQLSDTHILPSGRLYHGTVDTLRRLEVALDKLRDSGITVSALLLTGDLTDDGSPAAYRRLRDAVEPAAELLGAKVIYAMGNHDERAAFRTELLSGEPTTEACDGVHWLGGLRIIVLDSTIPGHHDCHLDDAQLSWLRAELATPAAQGTVLVLHHPPLPSPVPTVHLLRLRDAQRLGDVVAGSDVRIILSGHAHHTGCGSLADIPVWVSPASAHQTDSLPPRGRMHGTVEGGLSRIDLFGGTFVATAVPIEPAPLVYDEDEDERVSLVRSVVG
jgi:Icc protein